METQAEIVSSDLGGQCRAHDIRPHVPRILDGVQSRYYITRMKRIDLIALTLKCTNVAAAAILIVGTAESALIGPKAGFRTSGLSFLTVYRPLRRIDPRTGEILETAEMPPGLGCFRA